MLVFRAVCPTRQKMHRLFAVLQTEFCVQRSTVLGAVPAGGRACVGSGGVSCLAPLRLAQATPIVLLLGYLGVLEKFSGIIWRVLYMSMTQRDALCSTWILWVLGELSGKHPP